MSLPVTTYAEDWGGGKVALASVRCITCGCEYSVDPDYDVNSACPFCHSPCVKAVFQ